MKYYQYNSKLRELVEVRDHHHEKIIYKPIRGMSHKEIDKMIKENTDFYKRGK